MAIQTLNFNEINKIGGAGAVPESMWSDLEVMVLKGDYTGFSEMWNDMSNEDPELDRGFPPITKFLPSGFAD